MIEHNKSVQSGGFLRAQALKFPFFLVPFSFGNEREENSARRANTARLRAITGEGYGENVVTVTSLSERTQCYINRICYRAYAHTFGMGAPHPSPIGDTFPSRGRLCCASKFLCQHNRSRAKSNSDHRNSYFAAMPAAGATLHLFFPSCTISPARRASTARLRAITKEEYGESDCAQGSVSPKEKTAENKTFSAVFFINRSEFTRLDTRSTPAHSCRCRTV